jgi:RNA polymerase sigma-70 factor, ECF subfamily
VNDTSFLVGAACAGDRAALDALCARHAGRLLSAIRARMPVAVAARLSAEDILQETLLEAARKVGAWRSEGEGSFYRWLVGIARFKLLEAQRAGQAGKRALEVALDTGLAHAQTSPSGGAMRAERADALALALARLPERRAEAVRLRYLEGASLAQTAAALQCSESAVKALVARGLAELAGTLSPAT